MTDFLEETDESSASSAGSLSPVLDPTIHSPDIEAIPTECALRYGPSEHKYPKNMGRSGITPTCPLPAGSALSPKTYRKARLSERIQRDRLYTFTTRELQDSGR